MSWYKKYKILSEDKVEHFKFAPDASLISAPAVSNDAPEMPAPVAEITPTQDSNAQLEQSINFREEVLAKCLSYIEKIKPDFVPNETMTEAEIAALNETFINAISTFVRKANKEIENYNLSNPNSRMQIINWNDLGIQNPTSGVMRGLLLPFSGQGKKDSEAQDANLPALVNYIQSILASNNITDDEAGARLLADFSSSDDHADVRMLVNEYYAKVGRQNFHKLLETAGYPNLADEFAKIPDKELNYKEFFKKKQGAKVLEDEVFGPDYGLDTRSEAERQILSIFRAVDLQPLPAEIKMPSAKAKKGSKTINTEFMCDFLLPCEVLRGWNKDGSPIIESQVVFVGEYFGWYGSDYESKTSMKEELEPFQAVLSGNDVIFISKDDFAAGANALKLINQLEAKSIIFKGGKTKQLVDRWLSENKGKIDQGTYDAIEQRTNKLSPEQGIVRAAMLQLQFKFGEIAQFYQNYANPENSDYQGLVSSLYNEYKVLKAQSDDLNKRIRALQHKSKIEASNYDWNDTVTKSKDSEQIESLMEQLRQVNYKIRDVYVNNNRVKQIRDSHVNALQNSPDYQARLTELDTLYSYLEQGKDPLPNENVSIGRKVAEICNNSLAGLGVSLTRQTKQQAKEFRPMIVTALNRYRRIINYIL
jgi:hypothetical protein